MKARYNFWNIERPRNVSRRDYNHYQLLIMGTVATSFFSIGTAILAITGSANRLRGTEDLPVMSIAAAAQYAQSQAAGTRTDAVKLQGFLQATSPVTMPDAPDQRVLRGRIRLKAESGVRDELISETLLEWDQTASEVFFTDGTTRLPVAFDLSQIPMQEDRRASARVRYAGENVRFSKPVAIEYAEEIYPLSPELKAAAAESSQRGVAAKLTRKFFPDGQSVVMIAAIEATPDGGRIVDPLGDRLKILPGTEQEIASSDSKSRIFMGLFSIVLGVSAYMLKKAQAAKWQEFVIRSNE
ncbi:hypothetical protein IQ266_04785 [filamentous cyanobacterium LEGE 11480]|uniref:Uncharacterized protein n=1 Tax=Romeriopsis navalis LEGE 11480 TaxID=2777977 RepID=A0A928VI81_9CYAN|nr:hypothetical protein [Romeriopsis navalis]MBE9029076.1 hypothetical protein [Romeriopsis navalis LEGE 11480]